MMLCIKIHKIILIVSKYLVHIVQMLKCCKLEDFIKICFHKCLKTQVYSTEASIPELVPVGQS